MSLTNLTSQTIYIKNLNDKLKKNEMKRHLYCLFTQFGPLMDVVASKAAHLRGQAFIVFEDVATATTAMQQMQGYVLFDKKMKIQYAKAKSDVVAKADGSYQVKKKKDRQYASKVKEEKERERVRLIELRKGSSGMIADKPANGAAVTDGSEKRQREGESKDVLPFAKRPVPQAAPADEAHNVLFLEGLPEQTTGEILEGLFVKFEGFASASVPKPGIAFIEYDTPSNADAARMGLNGFRITDEHALKIAFAKKA